MDVNDLITAATAPEHQDQTARRRAVIALLTQHGDVDLTALETSAVGRWNDANSELDAATATPDQVSAHTDRMTRLSDVVLGIREHRQAQPAQQDAPQDQPQDQAGQHQTGQQAQQDAPAATTSPATTSPDTATAQPATTTPEQPPATTGAPVSALTAPPQEPAAPGTPEQPPATPGQPATPETPPPAAPPPAEPAEPATPPPAPAPPAEPVPPATPPAGDTGPAAIDVPAAPAGATPDSTTTVPPAVQQEVAAVTDSLAPAAPATGVAVAASAGPAAPAVPVVPDSFDWAGMPFDTVTAGAGGAPADTNVYAITASSGVPRYNLGQNLAVNQLADAFLARMEQLGRGLNDPMPHLVASASPDDWTRAYNSISRHGVASIALPASARHHVMRDIRDDDTIEAACNEFALPGGSLTAAIVAGTPGWCAPAEQRFEFCPPEVADQLLDMPTVVAPRGAVQYPIEPDFSALYSTPNLGWCYPAEAYDDPEPPDPAVPGPLNKPCIDVPCPDNENIILDPCGLCVRARILIATAYPEAVQKFLARVLVAWSIRQNARNIAGITGSIGAANSITVPAGLIGPGTTATVLEVVEYYNTWLRYRHMLGEAATIETVFPLWLRGPMRADLSKRMGGNGDMMDVTDQQLDAWLLRRRVRPQWVRGLDEAYNDPAQANPNIPASTLFGGGTNAPGTPATPFGVGAGTLWPTTARFLMYPAGSFVRFRLGLVNLEGGLIDSTLLGRNERLLMFVEEANKVARRCYQALSITVPVCPTGQTGGAGLTPLCGQPAETP